MIKTILKKYAPMPLLRGLQRTGMLPEFKIPAGRVKMGDLRRLQPLSESFGFDREGGPVDRFYIEQFLSEAAPLIKGRVLEIGDNEYTLAFGQKTNLQSEVLHVYEGNPKATIVGDLAQLPQVPDASFDCIILTQTLHLIYDFRAALASCYRMLKPGGSLLLTVPGITPIDHGEWQHTWFWSFTAAAIKKLGTEFFPAAGVRVHSYGNVLTAAAFLYGLGLKDLRSKELEHEDPCYPVVVTAILTR